MGKKIAPRVQLQHKRSSKYLAHERSLVIWPINVSPLVHKKDVYSWSCFFTEKMCFQVLTQLSPQEKIKGKIT